MNAKTPRTPSSEREKFTSSSFLGVLGVLAFIFSSGCARTASFTVHRDEFIGPPIVGFGAQMNPYLHCTPNSDEVTDENVKDLERKVLDLRSQHVRIFVMPKWWSGGETDVVAKDDPRIKQSMIRTIRLAQDAGASVNLTLWYGPFPDPDDASNKFVDMVAGLIRDEKLTAIKYLTIQNEPNGNESKISFETYNAMYRGLDKHLRAAGLREQIKIIGGDLVGDNQEKWFNNLAENLSDVLDGYSVHMYWDYWDTAKLMRRVSEVPRIVTSLPTKARKPIYLMEFGVRGKRDDPKVEPGKFKDGRLITQTQVQAMQIAWMMLETINRGYVAAVQWDCYDAWYDRKMGYGVIGDVKSGWEIRPAYHVLKIFTHTTKPGWRAVRVDGSDEAVLVAALRGDGDEMTVFALNRGERRVNVSIDGLGKKVKVSLKPLELKAISTREK